MNDDTLILYFYNDGLTKAERQQVSNALAADPVLAERYQQLSGELSAVDPENMVTVPQSFEHRLHATIDEAASREARQQHAPRRHFHFLSFLLGTAITAAIVAAIGVGLWLDNGQMPEADAPLVVQHTIDTMPGAFERGMKVYFGDSRHELRSLPEGDAERTALIMSLVEQNRFFAQLALRNDSPQLARVLRAFEPILVRLAAEDITPEESAALRAKLEFELNVMLTKLTREASEYSQPDEQET